MKITNLTPRPIRTAAITALLRRSASVSQFGQDKWIYEAFDEQREGYFVDIGAADGVRISNTFVLEQRYGWHGLCIEANSVTFEVLKQQRNATCINACIDAGSSEVKFALRGDVGGIIDEDFDNSPSDSAADTIVNLKTTSLESVLRSVAAPNVIDYLSIDVEGAEERILSHFDFNTYRFRTMTIERPTTTLQRALESHGYVPIREIPGVDTMFVHETFIDRYRANVMRFSAKRYLRVQWGRP